MLGDNIHREGMSASRGMSRRARGQKADGGGKHKVSGLLECRTYFEFLVSLTALPPATRRQAVSAIVQYVF